MSRLSHLDESGAAHMVNVGDKPRTARRALARGQVTLSPDAFRAVVGGQVPKGDVLAAARIAGIMAAKRTADLIPLCHDVPLSSVKVGLDPDEAELRIVITAEVETIDRTGVEMEALTAVSVAALTLYDMVKSVDRQMVIGDIRLIEKTGGRSDAAPERRPPVVVVPKSAPAEEVPPPAAPAPALVPPDPPAATTTPLRPRRRGDRRPSPEAEARLADVRELGAADLRALTAYLERDRIASAYLLGDLDLPYAEHCRWFGLPDAAGGAIEAVLLLYTGLSMPAVLTSGGAAEVEALIAGTRGLLPRRFYGHVLEPHRDALEHFYDAPALKPMSRMGLTRAAYRPTSSPEGVEPLTHRDTAAIMQLYQHYPDNFFEPAHLDTGLYFGVREGSELVSVAGIHVLSETHDIAVIGNIVTHTEYRGRGLAGRCVRRLLDELFARVGHVALNVAVGNEPAIRCYRNFGFAEHYRFLEGWAALP
jgi:cyclic pyranopterin phosphate synthase